MASESSELLVLSMQHESIQRYRYPFALATLHASRILGERTGSAQIGFRGTCDWNGVVSGVWTGAGATRFVDNVLWEGCEGYAAMANDSPSSSQYLFNRRQRVILGVAGLEKLVYRSAPFLYFS